MRRIAAAAASLLLVLAACSGGDDPTVAVPPSTTVSTSSTDPTATVVPLPAVTSDRAAVLATPLGFILPIEAGGPGAWTVMTPCGRTATVRGGTTIGGATVVLDPGHGGEETGAVGPGGLVERDLNMVVAEKTKAALEREGATVVLTRTADYRISLQTRGEIAQKLQPPVFISIHHNGGHDEERATPGTEVFFQIASPESRRLAGILYEELYTYFAGFDEVTTWYADRDAGAKYRPNDSGGDYYGILRRTNGITAVLSEALFLSNPQEEALLVRDDVQQGEAEAITRAVRRFMLGDDQGSGFTEPYPRVEPAGPGGGTSGCVDPPLE
ncbi:MAG TPA: N-acetylmuramoyl-L-alanine amidase [Acidimicrobiales bacterium]|nr:N-acetylmuramoyl-L-alanine amidase [Acidimicrobiales bacterium]